MDSHLFILFFSLAVLTAAFFWVHRARKKIRLLEGFRRDFVANISHELRTPLSVIKGYAETLSESRLDPQAAASFLKVIHDHTDRMIRMVENLLELSRLENVGPLRASDRISLPEFFRDLHERFQTRLERHHLSWEVEAAPSPESLEVDRGLLEMIFNNLIDNAVKFTDPGGRITIQTTRQGETVRFCVSDTGIGIPPKEKERIFQRFHRAHKDRGRESGGTGLGLAIVKHAIQSLGGKIWVESDVGKGSKFFFTLPLA